jgi:hypothetical protein
LSDDSPVAIGRSGTTPVRRLPSVAAVTINFGSPADTLHCVRSLRETRYPDLQIIVVDNGSPPAERERLRAGLPTGVTLIQSEKNVGFSGGNNLGIRRALDEGADYVLLLNNDATLKSDGLHIAVESAQKIPRLGILSGKILMADDHGPTNTIWSAGGWWSPLRASGYLTGIGEPDQGQYDRPGPASFLAACMWLVPAAVFGRLGLMPELFFIYSEDTDYCLEALKAGYRLEYEPRSICYHKMSQSHWKAPGRASPFVSYYANRNRIYIARKWLDPFRRLMFYTYFIGTRVATTILKRDRTHLMGLWDGLRGKMGPHKRPFRRRDE